MSVHLMPRSIYWATDVNPHYLDYLVTLRSTRPYMRVAHTDAMDAETFPTGQQFDTVVCLNVVEHVEDDLWRAAKYLERARAMAAAPSFWCPAGRGSTAAWTKCWGISAATREEQLVGVAEQAGFAWSRVLKFNRPGVVAWWLNGRILHRRTFGLGQIRMLNMLTPVFRLMDSWLPLPPLSIIAILRKEGGRGPGTGDGRFRRDSLRRVECMRASAPTENERRSRSEIAC